MFPEEHSKGKEMKGLFVEKSWEQDSIWVQLLTLLYSSVVVRQ